MRSHLEINIDSGVSLVDIKQLAMLRGTYVTASDRKLDDKPLYYVDHEVGLWTFEELKNHFLN